MRVISGSARGVKLVSPEGFETRPTADRIKETLFNIISFDLYNAAFLDVFAGSGAIGIEALSRGAKKAVFIDYSPKAADVINKNLQITKLKEKGYIVVSDVFQAIALLGTKGEKFDIIYADPPYYKDYINMVINDIIKNNILEKNGFIIAEQGSKEVLPEIPNVELFKTKQYKTTSMLFFRYWGDRK